MISLVRLRLLFVSVFWVSQVEAFLCPSLLSGFSAPSVPVSVQDIRTLVKIALPNFFFLLYND
ncbi:unnamed protein product [Moneuplotes crassus]|uniref:Uncharacterized protein n=1 Tax=Euplotes crassus TaxID=5936 RepID=A0AAD1XK18_EUPCR|nr:unnamed protein product [Moneuplotes crassus]